MLYKLPFSYFGKRDDGISHCFFAFAVECCGIVAAFLSEIGLLVSKNMRFLPKSSF
jgi:hypothetical protein